MYVKENVASKKDKQSGVTVRLEWTELGEGICGDYNPNDPKDIELLRFDVSFKRKNGDWEFPDDASYCTQFPVKASKKEKMDALKWLLNEYFEPVISHATEGTSVKKLGERLSWISPKSLKENKIVQEYVL